jgi:hypothetical protein
MFTFPPPATPRGYVGWVRTAGQKWRRVCSAVSYDEAVHDLLKHAERVGLHLDLCVLPQGRVPWRRS